MQCNSHLLIALLFYSHNTRSSSLFVSQPSLSSPSVYYLGARRCCGRCRSPIFCYLCSFFQVSRLLMGHLHGVGALSLVLGIPATSFYFMPITAARFLYCLYIIVHLFHPLTSTSLVSHSDADKVGLLKRSLALLYTPSHEHFGITPLEAMYLSRPVVAVCERPVIYSFTHTQTQSLPTFFLPISIKLMSVSQTRTCWSLCFSTRERLAA